ncbi:hypothetical protein FB45DRAFT_896135 [Roridomyces roridus]|uniref:Chromo domain-containing protein n=1 Tax=Roridomyces roridus TaxID=1738132 RepID=A0AAD7CAL0_9AGAR|nr:hypothetical protein FB45DRAFT_896135 [Roridomyces roridus]
MPVARSKRGDASNAGQSTSRRSSLFDRRDASLSPLTSVPNTPEPLPPPIVVSGQVLEPTVVFESLWWWLVERKKMDDARRAGRPSPWTQDEILQKGRFCNAYRVLDKTSQFVVTDVIETGSQDALELLFRIVLFTSFNKIQTWKMLTEAFGELTWAEFDIHTYGEVLSAASSRGQTLCTGAYMKIARQYEYRSNHMGHLQLLQMLMEKLPPVLKGAKFAADVYEEIAAFPGMAAFTTYQLMLSLSYSKLLNFNANDFVVPGPGASSGLAKMFGQSLKDARAAVGKDIESDILRHLVEHQRAYFARSNLEFPYLRDEGGHEHLLDVADFEHAVCETDKYAREKYPEIEGTSARTKIKRGFTASDEKLPAQPRLPVAWKDPARSKKRVRAGPIVVEKMYVCTKITDERPLERRARDGSKVEFLVWWYGYKEPTWEPERTIRKDAREIVETWLETKAKRK